MSATVTTMPSKSALASRFGPLTGRAASLISSPDSTSKSFAANNRPVNDDGAEIGHVGEGRGGPKQIADVVEKPRGIVVSEKRGGIEAAGAGARHGRGVDEGAGGVVRATAAAIGPVAVGGKRGNAGGAV